MNIKLIAPVLFFVLVILVPHISSADISWDQTDTTVEAGETIVTNQTISIAGMVFAIETGDGMRIIMDIPNDRLVMIDSANETYTETSISAMEQGMNDTRLETDRMIAEALKDIPPAQRAEIEAMMRKQMGTIEEAPQAAAPPLSYSPTGATERIAGHTAAQYTAREDDGTVHELWGCTDIKLDEVQEFYRNIKSIDMFGNLGEAEQALSYGFPLRTITRGRDGVTNTSEVTSIRHDPVPRTVLTVPEGFTREESLFEMR